MGFAERAGMSDERLQAKTGLDWAAWCERLDGVGALLLTHREMTREIHTRWPEVGMWWTQSVAVGYERIRGLRALGQMRVSDTFSASKSRTFNVSLEVLFSAFDDAEFREMWMEKCLELRSQNAQKTIRFDDGEQRIIATFIDKGPQKSAVAIEHLKLADAKARVQAKSEWGESFERLERHLEHQEG